MKHLTSDEIINYVSAEKIDDDFLKLADTVNLHIEQCDECLKKVRAFQLVQDEIVRIKYHEKKIYKTHQKNEVDQVDMDM